VAEIGCHSTFVKNTIEGRYFGTTQDAISDALGAPCDIYLSIKQPLVKEENENSPAPLFQVPDKTNTRDFLLNVSDRGLRPQYSFKNFAVSSTNQMAWAAAEAVSRDPGNAYNPLFLWGGVGVGKSHLMNAVGISILENDPETSVVCCTGEHFTNDIVDGIRTKSTQKVRNKYRKLKALMVDDIQFIAGKNAVQEEFFHTFNALVAAGSQVILTSDRPPSEISKLEERLKSRFEAGLIIDIGAPDFELRCAILQIKAKERGVDIPMDMIQLISGNLDTARKIEGFLVQLYSLTNVKDLKVTPEIVNSLLGKGIEERVKIRTNPQDMIIAVSKYYAIKKRSLLGSSRARPVSQPRQVLMYLLRTQLQLPFQEVGRITGGRDHTTVMHAVDKIKFLTSQSVEIREEIRGIKNLL
jgi:chromosomal replication initiator protein